LTSRNDKEKVNHNFLKNNFNEKRSHTPQKEVKSHKLGVPYESRRTAWESSFITKVELFTASWKAARLTELLDVRFAIAGEEVRGLRSPTGMSKIGGKPYLGSGEPRRLEWLSQENREKRPLMITEKERGGLHSGRAVFWWGKAI